VLDRATKVWAERSLAGRSPVEVVPGVLNLRFTQNPAGAFGLFGGIPLLFLVATLVAVLAIAVASRRLTSTGVAVGLGLIMGGALGNLTDRIARGPGLSGTVVDFFDLGWWPVFNVADVGIVLGAALVIVSGRLGRSRGRA
jgi:signal peptidase II